MEELEKLFRWDILINPDKYKETIDVDKIVADIKVDYEGVERCRRKIEAGEDISTIVVVKHPKEDLYAALDGHHRYWAVRWEELKEMDCAVIYDLVGLLFLLTREGVLQPPIEFTKYVRIPLRRAVSYLNEFLYNPEKLLRDAEKLLRGETKI